MFACRRLPANIVAPVGWAVVALSLTAFSTAAAAPTRDDIAECNREARERDHASGAPNRKDERSASEAREPRAGSAERTDATGHTIRSPDPQIDGMDATGAKDPAYRAAYRVCLRRRGF